MSHPLPITASVPDRQGHDGPRKSRLCLSISLSLLLVAGLNLP